MFIFSEPRSQDDVKKNPILDDNQNYFTIFPCLGRHIPNERNWLSFNFTKKLL